MSQTELLS